MLKYNTNKMENFGRVLISSIYKRDKRIEIKDDETYTKTLKVMNKNEGGLCEIVGLTDYQVKPYFDIDYKDVEKKGFDERIIDDMCNDIRRIYNNDIFTATRDVRDVEERYNREYIRCNKYSYRIYLKARITYSNIPILFKDVFDKYDIIDKSVYNPNRILFTPLSNRKRDEDVPPLNVIKGTIFDCCATYILEDYEDLDLRVVKESPKSMDMKNVLCDDTEDNDIDDEEDKKTDKYDKLKFYIGKLKFSRSDNFETWIKMCWCIMNICSKENITRRKCEKLIHIFSKLSKSNYEEDKVDEWIDKNFDKKKEIGYGWTYLVHTCIKEDDNEYYENITKSYYYMKKEFEKYNCKILYPPMVIHTDRKGENIPQPIPLCEKTNRHLECFIKDVKEKKGEALITFKKKRFIEMWLNDPKIRKYDSYAFAPPPNNVESWQYNSWTDFDIIKTPLSTDNTYKQDIINQFLDYTHNLFNNIEVVNYLLSYFSYRIQFPAKRTYICIIIYGEEGDGKNRFIDLFNNIFGEKYFIQLDTAKKLFSTHSCIEKEKLFICVNEAKGKDNYENSDLLKARITTNTLVVNPKGIQEYTIDNYCDYLMTTNNENAVNIHDKSRRYLYVETTPYYSGNAEFFTRYTNEIVENPKALRVIYEYLKSFDYKQHISSGNFQNHIPKTEIQTNIIKNNRDKILWFLEDMFVFDYFENDEYATDEILKFKNKDLFNKWNIWIERNKIEIKYSNIAFGTRLGLIIKKQINPKQPECITQDTNSNIYINVSKLKEFFKY